MAVNSSFFCQIRLSDPEPFILVELDSDLLVGRIRVSQGLDPDPLDADAPIRNFANFLWKN